MPGPSMHQTYAPSSVANAGSSGHRLNSPPYNLNPIRGQVADLQHQQGMHQQMAHANQFDAWPTTPTHHMPTPNVPSQYSTPRPSWDFQLGVGTGMGMYSDSGQGGNPTGVETQQHAQHPLHHVESARAAGNGELLQDAKSEVHSSGGQLRHQVRTS